MATNDEARCPETAQASRTEVKVGIMPDGNIILRLSAGLLSVDINLSPKQVLDLMHSLVEALDARSNRKTTEKD